MSGMSINKILHSSVVLAIDSKSTDFTTVSELTEIKCSGFNKLMIQYILSTTDWDRVGNIDVYGSFSPTGTYTAFNFTIENYSFEVSATADSGVGAGELYVIENIPPYVKLAWDNTTVGTTGTISVYAMPFNG